MFRTFHLKMLAYLLKMEFSNDNVLVQPGEESVFLVGADKGEGAAVAEIGEIIVEEQGKVGQVGGAADGRKRIQIEDGTQATDTAEVPAVHAWQGRGLKHQAKKIKNELN